MVTVKAMCWKCEKTTIIYRFEGNTVKWPWRMPLIKCSHCEAYCTTFVGEFNGHDRIERNFEKAHKEYEKHAQARADLVKEKENETGRKLTTQEVLDLWKSMTY